MFLSLKSMSQQSKRARLVSWETDDERRDRVTAEVFGNPWLVGQLVKWTWDDERSDDSLIDADDNLAMLSRRSLEWNKSHKVRRQSYQEALVIKSVVLKTQAYHKAEGRLVRGLEWCSSAPNQVIGRDTVERAAQDLHLMELYAAQLGDIAMAESLGWDGPGEARVREELKTRLEAYAEKLKAT